MRGFRRFALSCLTDYRSVQSISANVSVPPMGESKKQIAQFREIRHSDLRLLTHLITQELPRSPQLVSVIYSFLSFELSSSLTLQTLATFRSRHLLQNPRGLHLLSPVTEKSLVVMFGSLASTSTSTSRQLNTDPFAFLEGKQCESPSLALLLTSKLCS